MKLSTLISVPAIMLSSLAFSQTVEANKLHSVSFQLGGGWQYRWDSGMGVNTGIQYQTMGDLKVSSLNVGISYSF